MNLFSACSRCGVREELVPRPDAHFTVMRGRMTLILRNVPALRACRHCGAADLLDEATSERLAAFADEVRRLGLQLAVKDFGAS